MKHLVWVLAFASAAVAADLDVFLLAGQSNCSGAGLGAMSPRVPPECLSYFNSRITTANDPVGYASTGSAWPSFCRAYYFTTRRAVMVIPAAIGGTAQCAAVNPNNWDTTGALVPRALQMKADALAAATAAGWTPHFRGTIWCQGEGDAFGIGNRVITADTYKSAFFRMIGRFSPSPEAPFYVSRTGGGGVGSDDTYLAQIRKAQEDVVTYYAVPYHIRMVYRGAAYYAQIGLANGLHYLQDGYNLMGRSIAKAILNDGIPDLRLFYDRPYPYGARIEFAAY